MIKLCTGSVLKTLSLCRVGNKPSDDDLADLLFSFVGDARFGPSYIGHVKRCTKNLPIAILDYFRNTDIASKVGDIRENCRRVFDMLPSGSDLKAVSTLYDIIKNDPSLSKIILGIDPRYRGSTIVQSRKFEASDFLANILISVCKDENIIHDSNINKLDSNYIESCLKKHDLHLVSNIDELDPLPDHRTPDPATIPSQNNYGNVVINNPGNLNYFEHVESITFD